MFCFCFQSPSLKLQALEADSGPHPALVDHRPPWQPHTPPQPLSPGEPGPCLTQELHSPPSSPAPERRSLNSSQPGSSLVLYPASLCVETQLSPPASDPPDLSPLLSRLIATNDRPVLSPRCHSPRYNLDPDAAPSPPCSQHVPMHRCRATSEAEGGGRELVSVTTLSRHIHTVKKRIRRFEERFEQERHYKPAHNDKTANPEVSRLMKELIKSRKQLKELKLKQSITGRLREPSTEPCRTGTDQRGAARTGTELQKLNNNSSAEPSLEETVHVVTNRVKERRQELSLPDNIKEMSHSQMCMEKSSLQKCLLYFESLHGRPSSRHERALMKPFYDRYRLVKQLLSASAASTVVSTIEEEENSDEERPKLRPCQAKPPTCVSSDESLCFPLQELSDTPPVSPLDEVKGLQTQVIAMATLHEASRSELEENLRTTRLEKKKLHRALRECEARFYTQTGRVCQKEDRGPMAEEHSQYKSLKAKLRLLEALLSKQQD
ncbi:protein FAM13A-like [Genypterus blacodes]|uniref:protein FAM13A-like n=1 Tax=Genypterus blacodes TaxID=154954 RepID=UPI003F776282